MKIVFIADGRSAIARNWISHFTRPEHEIHLVSTSACAPLPGLTSLHILPVAFSGAGIQVKDGQVSKSGGLGLLRRLAPIWLRTFIRQRLGPLTLPRTAKRLSAILNEIQPDLVHAMRYPYEGILAALSDPAAPLLVSVWGNDFTLHAAANPAIDRYTRRALARTDALHTDCQRDLTLAYRYGYPADRPVVVLPGSGGVKREIFFPPKTARPPAPPVIINPRGFRTYIRNDVFFKAIPLVLAHYPQARFICPAMADEAQAQAWLTQYQITGSVELMPLIPHKDMGEVFRQAHIVVSPSTHDGTPNTLLEAIACNCFPVAGDIDSIREWIIDGENGLLVDPANPSALADAIVQAIEDTTLRQQAAEINQELIAARAEFQTVMARAETFYQGVLHG
ncbi:MAG TPA: glycosyltransferase family 4 protein [Anaerolineales bacterium]|nr:glycosyltransferase family 4 protein [Anaerolineales bacterium]